MVIEGIEFPEIQTEYDYFTIRFEDKEFKLLYRIRQYVIIPSQKVDKFRRNNIKLKTYGYKKNDNTVTVAYYQPYAVKLTSLKVKKRLISFILKEMIGDNELTLEQHIEKIWYDKNVHKTTKKKLMDKEAILLDILANYYLGGVEGEGILTQDMSRTIKQKEIVTIAGMMNTDEEDNIKEEEYSKSNWEVRTMSKKKHNKYMRYTPKRWKQSKTHKLNSLYSYNDHKDEKEIYDWVNDEWVDLNQSYHYEIDRLINPEEEYIAEWCLVNTENEFEFKGKRFKIDKSVKQYKIGKDKQYDMDKILIIEQYDKKYYFDQDIKLIQNEKIKILPDRGDSNGIKNG